ncbi:MAG: phosphate regulon transcriptional regulator PhoB [Alphaproteobacteria bacterium]|jgi:two-component system, OmpR family, phosphate regulon response regulator PhoB|nr:phosphate regulon transcriptional regulator PhoB [Alphaproteobacteria bacterium]MBT5860083.1 phosphate regulon transcriptional regulator PhoB [Alphaproteobacteria bacterium]
MKPHVLIVEDDAPITEMLLYNLEAAGFRTTHAADGTLALRAMENEKPDLVILDWMLPKLSGIDVCRTVRRTAGLAHLPVIMLTAKGEEADRIRGLNAGADDYVVKPFSPNELIARVHAVLRRAGTAGDGEPIRVGDLIMNLQTRTVERDGREVALGPTEFRLLHTLMERPGTVFSRNELLERVWGRDIHVEPRTVDVHIRRLRKSLNAGEKPDAIRTVRSAGYALATDGT